MRKEWVLNFRHMYGMNVPDPIQSEGMRLGQLLAEHCRGPYDENGIEIGVAIRVEGKFGVPFTYTGIRTAPFAKNWLGADIYVKRSDWEVPLTSYKQFLWSNVETAILVCVEKLKKKKIPFDAGTLSQHLALVEAEFLAEDLKPGALDPAARVEAMPVDKYAKDEKHQVVVQFRIEGHGTVSDLDRRVAIEDLLGGFLKAADLGYCDGGDIGSGTINIFCSVKPGRKAVEGIIETLRKNNRLDGAVIAETVKGEEKVIWPPGFTGEFQLI